MPLDPKLLYRHIESAVERAAGPGSVRRFAERLLGTLVAELRTTEGIDNAQLFERRDGRWKRLAQAGAQADDVAALLIARFQSTDLGAADWPWSERMGDATLAVFPITPGADLLLSLHVANGDGPAEGAGLAAAIQYAVQHQLRRRELEDAFEQARAIQTSLLPQGAPAFGEFELAAFSRPAHKVGGDLFDYLPLDPQTLGIAIADAAGHGLPAALQARDVVTGLRMGVERDLRLARTIEKLNRVIHRSGLTSRFVSLVFAELERNGTLLYVNAGHPPPMLCDEAGVHELTVGGMLLGPAPEASYKMGFAHLDRGAMLLLYTDGLIERPSPSGEHFGTQRLAAWLSAHRHHCARAALEDLEATLEAFAGGATPDDDATAVIVRRPPAAVSG